MTASGKYGDAIKRIPIKAGDIVEVHSSPVSTKVRCGSIFHVPIVDLPKADLLYVDPPWTMRVLNQFYRYAGEKRVLDLEDLIVHIGVQASCCCRGWVFMEMGKKHTQDAVGWLDKGGVEIQNIFDVEYGGGNRHCLLAGYARDMNPGGREEIKREIPEQARDSRVLPEWAIDNFTRPGDTVYDPCCGEGCTLRHAYQLGRHSYGIELIPGKAALAIERLAGLC